MRNNRANESREHLPEFLPSILDVRHLVRDYLGRVAGDYKGFACDHVVAGREGAKYVLSGLVAFRAMKAAYTDGGREHQEMHLILGHAALGPAPAMRAIDSVRKELLALLEPALPAGALCAVQGNSFRVVLPDGELVLEGMSEQGRSYINATMKAPKRPLSIAMRWQ